MTLTSSGFFCFSLHTGTVLIGWIGFVSAFFSIIGFSLYYDDIDGFIKDLNITKNGRLPIDWDANDEEFMRHAAIAMITILIGFFIIEAIASLFLVHGASNNKRLMLVPWLLERSIHLIYQVIIWLTVGFYFFTSDQSMQYSVFTFIVGGLVIYFYFYCFLCVYSLFVLMREAEEYQRLINGDQQYRPPPSYGNRDTTYVKL